MEFVIITGMSGGGKSRASDILEDAGYYCIDNMPAGLIPDFASLYSGAMRNKDVSFTIDVRGENDFNTLFSSIESLKRDGHTCKIIFVECSTEVLINRYKETRRMHPLVSDTGMSISDAINKEREMLYAIKDSADVVIDTSKTNLAQLRDRVLAAVKKDVGDGIFINCMSFGFKHGAAVEADLVFDVRCFPNPFYIPELKHKTGLDSEVRDFVFSSDETKAFVKKLFEMVDMLLPLYVNEGKHQLTVALGCTGGKHRSVAIAEALRAHLFESGYKAVSFHRDIAN